MPIANTIHASIIPSGTLCHILTFCPPRLVRVRHLTPNEQYICEWAETYPGGAMPGDIICEDIPRYKLRPAFSDQV